MNALHATVPGFAAAVLLGAASVHGIPSGEGDPAGADVAFPAVCEPPAGVSPGEERIERLLSLDTRYSLRRDGFVEVEKRFRLVAAGEAIRRGPALTFLTVFEGPAGLTLHNDMRIVEAQRNGRPEPWRIESGDGHLTLFLGASDVLLPSGEHDYLLRYTALSEWIRLGNDLFAVFEVTEPFSGLSIERISASIRLPEGVDVQQFTPALSAPRAALEGLSARRDGNLVEVEVTSPLAPGDSLFINAVWSSEQFGKVSRWREVLLQHPRIPLSIFSAAILAWALALLLARILRRGGAPPPRLPASG